MDHFRSLTSVCLGCVCLSKIVFILDNKVRNMSIQLAILNACILDMCSIYKGPETSHQVHDVYATSHNVAITLHRRDMPAGVELTCS